MGEWQAFTLVPWFGDLPVGGGGTSFVWVRNKTSRLLRDHSGGASFLLWADISWNVSGDPDQPDSWQVHFHGLVRDLTDDGLAELLEHLKASGDHVHKPIVRDQIYDLAGWLAYASKPNFRLRTYGLDESGETKLREGNLSLDQEVQVARWLSEYRVDQRLIRVRVGDEALSSVAVENHFKSMFNGRPEVNYTWNRPRLPAPNGSVGPAGTRARGHLGAAATNQLGTRARGHASNLPAKPRQHQRSTPMDKQTKSPAQQDPDVRATRIAQHRQTGEWFLEVAIPPPVGPIVKDFVPFRDLDDPTRLRVLLNKHGYRFFGDADRKSEVLGNLARERPTEICYLTEQLGWDGDTYVLPERCIKGAPGPEVIYQGAGPVPGRPSSSGTLDEWKELAKLAEASTWAVHVICTSLAPIVMRFVDAESGLEVESGLFHASGPSGCGKTTLARVANSPWRGGPRPVGSWDTSPAGFEETLLRNNDGFVCLDETSTSSANKTARREQLLSSTYKLTSGQTRTRSQAYRDAPRGFYRVLGLSTGEQTSAAIASAAEDARQAGEEARVIDLPIGTAPTGVFDRLTKTGWPNTEVGAKEVANALNKTAAKFYGTAAPALIQHVADDIPEAGRLTRRYVRRFMRKLEVPADGWEQRFARKFALPYAAGRLGIDYGILPWGPGLVFTCIKRAYLRAREAVVAKAGQPEDLFDKLKELITGDQVVDLVNADEAPDSPTINKASVLRHHYKDEVCFLVHADAFGALSRKPEVESLRGRLEAAGCYVRPAEYPRFKACRIRPSKGAERRYFFVFTESVLTFAGTSGM